MIRIRVLNELLRDPVQGPGISQMSYLIKAFIAFLENHDQVANSGDGSRLRALTSPGRYRALVLRSMGRARETGVEFCFSPAGPGVAIFRHGEKAKRAGTRSTCQRLRETGFAQDRSF